MDKDVSKDILLKSSPTARVKILALNLLSDGLVHSRKEIVEYVIKKGKEYGLEDFRQGCISGGIRKAVNTPSCEKLESATYRMSVAKKKPENCVEHTVYEHVGDDPHKENENISLRFIKMCDGFSDKLTALSREIDYVNADDEEIEQLNLMRQCIQDIKLWKEKIKKKENL